MKWWTKAHRKKTTKKGTREKVLICFSFHYYFLLSRQKHFRFFISENVQYNQCNSEQISLNSFNKWGHECIHWKGAEEKQSKSGYSPYLQSILRKPPTTTVLWHHSVLPASNTKKIAGWNFIEGIQNSTKMRFNENDYVEKVRYVFTQTSYIGPTRGAVLTAQVPLSLFFFTLPT